MQKRRRTESPTEPMITAIYCDSLYLVSPTLNNPEVVRELKWLHEANISAKVVKQKKDFDRTCSKVIGGKYVRQVGLAWNSRVPHKMDNQARTEMLSTVHTILHGGDGVSGSRDY